MTTLKLTKIGTETVAILPEEMLARLRVKNGDSLFAIETKDGYLLTPYDPTIAEQLDAGLEFMKEYRDSFKTLAK